MKSKKDHGVATVALEREEAKAGPRAAGEDLFRMMFEHTADALMLLDADAGRFIDCNQAAVDLLRCADKKELLALHPAQISPPSQPDGRTSREKADDMIATALRDGSHRFEWVHCSARRADFPAEVLLTPIPIEEQVLIVATLRDITRRKEREMRILRLNRVHAMLSGVNSVLMRVRERQELFDEGCRISVEYGKFIFAWIGMLDAGTQLVTPVARAGREDGYLSRINLSAREDAPGSCRLIARALTQAAPAVCNDIASEEHSEALRSEALKRGYRSMAAFPFIAEGRPVGVGALYASEPGFFDEEEMRLLSELAGDIGFALDYIEKREQLDQLAYYDALTGLPNRTLFFDRLTQLLHTTGRSGDMLAVVLIDLERFRGVNETFGRHAGDAVLKQVADLLGGGRLGPDHLARIGADSFAAVLGDIEKEADIVHFLERRVIALLHQPISVGGHELRISAKAGIAMFPANGTDAETLFRNAEAALKKAKLFGDKYLFYTPELNARVAENLALENKLRQALEQKQLMLHYQPKVDLRTGQISGLEALMRWNDPDAGPVPPVKFIPILEETGMILEAGRWAMEQAIEDWRKWRAGGLRPPRIAVNVSAIQLRQKDFVGMVEQVLGGAGDAASALELEFSESFADALELEITESLVMQDIEANIEKLRRIRNMGVEVAIDDFGTGYSSLSYIARLPVHTLKIDRAFIDSMTGRSDNLSIVSTIISLARSLGLKVVAEGVETEDQLKLLWLLKCDEMQGYLFSPAVPAGEIARFLREKKTLNRG